MVRRKAGMRPSSKTTHRDLVHAKCLLRDHYRELLAQDPEAAQYYCRHDHFTSFPGINVVAIGLGEKITGRKRTGEPSVTVFVARKYPRSRMRRQHLVEPSVSGVKTDVVEIGYPIPYSPRRRQRVRPVQPGISVSPDYGEEGWESAGTFGVIVEDTHGDNRYILSNNHVLSDEDYVPLGTPTLQPGSRDGGSARGRIARLAVSVPLKYENRRNWMDAAMARLYANRSHDPSILGIGPPRGAGTATQNARVRKSGRTTGVTHGVIRELKVDVLNMQFENGSVRMDDVIAIEGTNGMFSKVGDSGSAIVDDRDRVVGLLFGGSGRRDFAIPIQRILKRFDVRIAT